MNPTEMKARAERIAARLNAMGFTKDGKPMVVDQAYELVAAEEGFRNQHALRASFTKAALCIPRELTEDFAKAILVQHTLDDSDWDIATDAWGFIIAEAEKHTKALEQLALIPDHPEQCDGSDFIVADGVRGVWLTLGELSVHVCRGSQSGPEAPDAGVRVYVHPLFDQEVVLADLVVSPDAINAPTDRISVDFGIRDAADAAFEAYNFGEGCRVAAHNGWEWTGDNIMTKAVFLEDDATPDAASTKVTFRVEVVNGLVQNVSVD